MAKGFKEKAKEFFKGETEATPIEVIETTDATNDVESVKKLINSKFELRNPENKIQIGQVMRMNAFDFVTNYKAKQKSEKMNGSYTVEMYKNLSALDYINNF